MRRLQLMRQQRLFVRFDFVLISFENWWMWGAFATLSLFEWPHYLLHGCMLIRTFPAV